MSSTDDPSIDDILAACGSLPPTSGPEAIETFLATLFGHYVEANPVRRELLRQGAIARLRTVSGITAPARLVDASLSVDSRTEERENEVPEDTRSAEELYDAGKEILEAASLHDQLRADLRRLRFAGSTAPVELLDLALLSRSLARPINVGVMGPSAAGKSFSVETVRRFHPPEAMYLLTASSERALAYSGEDLAHRHVVIAEATGIHWDGIGATIIRELAWGQELRYEFVEKTKDGLRARLIVKPGPTGLITTTTKDLEPEVATRLLQMHIVESADQTRAVLRALADRASGSPEQDLDLDRWHAARRWLAKEGETRIAIPFAAVLSEQVPALDVRMRRDFEQILTVIAAHAFGHQRTRPRSPQGLVIATPDDYRAAYNLLADVLAVTLQDTPPTVKETVDGVRDLLVRNEAGVTVTDLANHLEISKGAASRRKDVAIRRGFLVNAEMRKGYPARLQLGEPVPVPQPVLPAPELLEGKPTVNATSYLVDSNELEPVADLFRTTHMSAPPPARGSTPENASCNTSKTQPRNDLQKAVADSARNSARERVQKCTKCGQPAALNSNLCNPCAWQQNPEDELRS